MLNTGLVSVGIWQLFDFWEDLNDSDGQWSEGCQGVRPALTLILGKQSARASRLGVFSSLTWSSQSVWQPSPDCRNQTIFISIKFLILNKQYCKLFFPFEFMKSKWWICLLPDYVEKVEKEDISPVKMVDSGDTDCDHLPGSCHLPRHGHETWRKWTVMETLIHVSPISLSSVVSALIFHTFRCLSHNFLSSVFSG